MLTTETDRQQALALGRVLELCARDGWSVDDAGGLVGGLIRDPSSASVRTAMLCGLQAILRQLKSENKDKLMTGQALALWERML